MCLIYKQQQGEDDWVFYLGSNWQNIPSYLGFYISMHACMSMHTRQPRPVGGVRRAVRFSIPGAIPIVRQLDCLSWQHETLSTWLGEDLDHQTGRLVQAVT